MEEFFNNIKESFKEATLEFETINIKIDSTEWINVHKKLRDEFNLKFFSWLSAIAVSYTHLTLPTTLLV